MFYVHHHGRGHRTRTERILAHLQRAAVVMTSDRTWTTETTTIEHIPSDVPIGVDLVDLVDPTAGGTLHWAPLHPPTMARRSAQIIDAIRRHDPCGIVIDVSVEVALLSRLCGLPTMYVRQHGNRTDDAHCLAYRSADRLLAPWPIALEASRTPSDVRGKTEYAGFIVAPDVTPTPSPTCEIGVLWSDSNDPIPAQALTTLGTAVPTATIRCVGPVDGVSEAPNVVVHGWEPDPWARLRDASVVVASAGNNSVAEAAARDVGLVVIPQDRPFKEQHVHARQLERAGWAAAANDWLHDENEWKLLLRSANQRRHGLHRASFQPGAATAANLIDNWTARWCR